MFLMSCWLVRFSKSELGFVLYGADYLPWYFVMSLHLHVPIRILYILYNLYVY